MILSEVSLLFVCTANRHRSRTAHHIFSRTRGITTRSAGTEVDTIKQIATKNGPGYWAYDDREWWAESQQLTQFTIAPNYVDLVVFMAKDHFDWASDNLDLGEIKTITLGIPDIYNCFEPKLLSVLSDACERTILPYLEEEFGFKLKRGIWE